MGTLLVIPSFTGIFFKTPGFLGEGRARNIWYCVLPAIFNVGWASVQISHMAIVNQLSYSVRRRDRMVNNRNSATYVANIAILTVALFLFIIIPNSTTCFSVLCLMSVGVGSFTSLFYVWQIKENPLSAQALTLEKAYKEYQNLGSQQEEPRILIDPQTNPSRPVATEEITFEVKETANMRASDKQLEEAVRKSKKWSDWLREAQFYIFGLVYTFARMALNTTATMMPLYLTTVTGYEEVPGKGIPAPIAAVPLCSYICSLIYTQYGQAKLSQMFRSRIMPLVFSCVFTTIGSVPYAFLNSDPSVTWLVYPLACVQGVGIAMMLNTSCSLISDEVSQASESSAFV